MFRNGLRTADAEDLTTGVITTLQYLRRVGSQIVGVATTIASVLRETGGPTDLTVGAIADTEMLVRSGTTIVGSSPGMSRAQVLLMIDLKGV